MSEFLDLLYEKFRSKLNHINFYWLHLGKPQGWEINVSDGKHWLDHQIRSVY